MSVNMLDLVNFGALGIIVVLILVGKLVPKGHLDAERERRQRAETKVDAYEHTFTHEVLPALQDATRQQSETEQVVRTNTEILVTLKEVLRDV